MHVFSEDLDFLSSGVSCKATAFRPEKTDGALPIVVMGHGFSGTRDLGLPVYARAFVENGFAVLTFDYRYFGDSGGEPRQVLDGEAQQGDFLAALAFARSLSFVDPRRVALWGTSFSAGHVLVVAASDPTITAAIIQVPGLSASPGFLARILFFGCIDLVAAAFHRGPYYRPVVGARGDGAVIVDTHARDVMLILAETGSSWRNTIALRGIFGGKEPNARNLTQPLLVCIAEQDRLAPSKAARRAAERAPKGELKSYPIGHFDAYLPPARDLMIADQIAFLRRHLIESPLSSPVFIT